MADPKHSKNIQMSLVAGFKGGWRAGLLHFADQMEAGRRAAARGSILAPAEPVTCDVDDLVQALRSMAEHAPTPETVAMRPGESAHQAVRRGADPALVEPPPSTGPIPTAEEAFQQLAAVVTAMPPGAVLRRKRAEWVAICGFALFTRDCAAADGLVDELDREAARMRDLIAGGEPLARAKPAGGAVA